MCLYIQLMKIHGTYKHKRIFQNECSISDQVYHEGVSTTLTVKKPWKIKNKFKTLGTKKPLFYETNGGTTHALRKLQLRFKQISSITRYAQSTRTHSKYAYMSTLRFNY